VIAKADITVERKIIDPISLDSTRGAAHTASRSTPPAPLRLPAIARTDSFLSGDRAITTQLLVARALSARGDVCNLQEGDMRHAAHVERNPHISRSTTSEHLLARGVLMELPVAAAPPEGAFAPQLDLPLLRDRPSSLTCGNGTFDRQRMPDRRPAPGEQYRFHFDMSSCIGCKCCVVACNEQNGNPAAINWRRVAEIEGGWYPLAQRSYLSMGCNHCLEPTCLSGCPVDAYSKDAATGIVLHSADTCIGCQYCTWNCEYGAPQYNAERGVVGKCDMCHGRLALGQAPACVSACPESAIRIEIVNIADWRATYDTAVSTSGIPVGDGSVSATRIKMPVLAPNAKPTDITHVRPAEPHWPLVVMTVLTQLAVGALATVWVAQMLGASTQLGVAALLSLIVGGLALTASTLHLGRPVHSYRAIKMWRRSWLSREVLLFSAFSGVASLYAAALWTLGPAKAGPAAVLGALTVLLGVAGVVASGCIYRVPSRPAWNSRFTVFAFVLTAGVLGPLFVTAAGAGGRWLVPGAATLAGGQLTLLVLRFLRLIASDSLELRGTARLLATTFASRMVARGALLVVGGIVLPLVAAAPQAVGYQSLLAIAALVLALGGEVLGRYLFFVSAVPTHMAAPYLATESEAA
jgi:formate dehydrogenase iron-sulfur subunit